MKFLKWKKGITGDGFTEQGLGYLIPYIQWISFFQAKLI